MDKIRVRKLITLAIESLWIFFIASLLHFGYSATKIFPLSYISAVNESVWEHSKIIFFAALFYSIYLYFRSYKGNSCFVAGLAPSLFSILLSVPLLFYGYTAITGSDVFILDLLVAYLSGFIYRVILDLFARSGRDCSKYKIPSILFVVFLVLSFFVLTWYPLQIPLFEPPK